MRAGLRTLLQRVRPAPADTTVLFANLPQPSDVLLQPLRSSWRWTLERILGCQANCLRATAATPRNRTARARRSPASRVNWKRCRYCDGWYTARGHKRCGCVRPAAGVRRGTTLALTCKVCGSVFNRRSTTRRPEFCSDWCRTHNPQAAATRRIQKARRRARKRQAEYEPVNPLTIYERDAWTCQLCGKRIDRTKTAPHPKAPTIDHLLPLAQGGAHVPANLQAAHFRCNVIKSDGLGNTNGDQLRLLG